MNRVHLFVITIVLTALISGCGSNKNDLYKNSQQTENNRKTDTTVTEQKQQTPQQNKESETINNTQEDQSYQEEEQYNDDDYTDNDEYEDDEYYDYIKIIDSSLSYAPNINLHDSTPQGAYYSYISDPKMGHVLSLHTNGLENSFHILGYDTHNVYEWCDMPSYQNRQNISWDSKFDNDFIIFIVVKFMDGHGNKIYRDLVYTPTPNGYDEYTNEFMHISLGSGAKDGQWHHYSRNILSDIRRFYPNAIFHYDSQQNCYLNGFAIRGSGEITNLILH